MSVRTRHEAFLRGAVPDTIPFSMYARMKDRHDPDDPTWQELFRLGLGLSYYAGTVRATYRDVQWFTEERERNGTTEVTRIVRTPIGEARSVRVRNRRNTTPWHQRYLLETEDDYRIVTYAAKHTSYEPDYKRYSAVEAAAPDNAIVKVAIGRSPLQNILVDYAGLENFSYHLYDLREPMMELYDALLENYKRAVEIAADGPGSVIWGTENFTAETVGPSLYERFLLPVYESVFPSVRQAGKVVVMHFDGNLRSCKHLVAQSPIDVIESLTPPPEGDMELDECRAAWPDKLFWSNLNVGCYDLAEDQLADLVRKRVEQGSVGGARLALEISEDLPRNWRRSLPVVLRTLSEIRYR